MISNKKRNLIEVTEYQRIVDKKKIDLSQIKDEGKKSLYVPVEPNIYSELKNFVVEYNSSLSKDDDPLEFIKPISDKQAREVILIKNYVGLIKLKSGVQIEILPKIELGNTKNAKEETKKIFVKMLMCLNGFPAKLSGNAMLKIKKGMTIFELFISMFVDEVRTLVQRGLKSGYVTQEDNLYFFKGKLKMNEQINYNFAHKERFYVEYDDFVQNRPENRLIKSTLLKLLRVTSDTSNSKYIKQLLTAFETVEPSSNYERDIASIVIDRSTGNYRLLMDWVKVFLFNKSFTNFSGNNESRAILFSMQDLFEAYVAKQVVRLYTPLDWTVYPQHKQYYLFNEPSNIFRIKPDVVIEKNDRLVIMDTKWKRLNTSAHYNYGISQGDMYQMYAYSMKYYNNRKLKTFPEVWVLYPKTEEMISVLDSEDDCTINFRDDEGVKIHAYFLDIESLVNDSENNSLTELLKRIESEQPPVEV